MICPINRPAGVSVSMASVRLRKPTPSLQRFKDADEMGQRPPEAVEFPGHEYVTSVACVQAPVQLGTLANGAPYLVSIDGFAARPF